MSSSNDTLTQTRDGGVPKDMKGLLQFCMRAGAETSDTDTARQSNIETLAPEKREWLEKALEDMTVSPVQRMKECLAVLEKDSNDEDLLEEKNVALEELMEWCENMDYAIDFHKIGGYPVLPGLLDSSEAEIRWQTLELMATLFQNNPYCQHAALQNKLLPIIVQILDKDSNCTVKTKALLALSCLCRDFPDAQKEFVDNDGFSVLMRAMQSDTDKLKVKAAFMLCSICKDRTDFKDILCNMGMVDQLVGLLQEDHSSFHEHLMSALLTIVKDHPQSIQECEKPELHLSKVLTDRLEFLKGKEEFQEEYDYAKELLNMISSQEDAVGQELER